MFNRKHFSSLVAIIATVGFLSACNKDRNQPAGSASAAPVAQDTGGNTNTSGNPDTMVPQNVEMKKVTDATASVLQITDENDRELTEEQITQIKAEYPGLKAALEQVDKVTDSTISKSEKQGDHPAITEFSMREHDQNVAVVQFAQGEENAQPKMIDKRGDFPLQSVHLVEGDEYAAQEDPGMLYSGAVLTFKETRAEDQTQQQVQEQQTPVEHSAVVRVHMLLVPPQHEEQQQQPVPEVKQVPQAETKQAPQAETKQAPQAEMKQAPQAETKQTPQAEMKQAPQGETKSSSIQTQNERRSPLGRAWDYMTGSSAQ